MAPRKPGPVLDAPEALLFGGRDQLSVPDEARGRIGVIGVDSKN
jgi:hypothetical protein